MKKTQTVTREEMAAQRAFSQKVKELVAAGKRPLAMVVTYGCQQNENDSERIKGMLAEMGYGFTEDKEAASLILFNTCAVREGAELRVLGNIGALKHLKAKKPELLIGICGCMMQQDEMIKTIQSKYRHVSIVFGTHTLYRFPEILFHALSERQAVIDVENIGGKIAEDIPVYREGDVKAWVSIMYGCNNFCTYCIVPYVRGRERSRKPEDILAEIRELAARGVKEITLLGQNVNSYGKDLEEPVDFADLLKQADSLAGIRRIRFMTSHPKDVTDKLIDTMASCEKLCSQLHLPFQAGSDRILKLMNRKYTREDYLKLIQKVRKKMPDTAFTTDVIVGFPGETAEDFQETLSLLETVRFDGVYSFIYSKREGTRAAAMPDHVTHAQKTARMARMLEIQDGIVAELCSSLLGTSQRVLVEGPGREAGIMTGRLDNNMIVEFPCTDESLAGTFCTVHIGAAKGAVLKGALEA